MTAFCILCHKFSPVLAELVRQLDVPGNEIFIHVDGKTSLDGFAPLRSGERVHFIEPRTKVHWGGFGMIEATLRLFERTRSGNFNYIVLLSGDTLPLLPAGEIQAFLQKAYAEGREFVSTNPTVSIEESQWVRLRRFCPDKSTLGRRIKRLVMKCCMRRRNPLFQTLPPLEKGSQWIAVTNNFRDYIFDYLAAHPDYIPAFRYGHATDEIFFQTLICDSPFAERNARYPLVYTDWSTPAAHPKLFRTEDLPAVAAARLQQGELRPPLFARKFDNATDIDLYRKTILHEN